ncbi:hypothetical protein TNCV_4428761 [Trichonephila clavipes]|nr:hypothetical protein TNCV_4428761 [Trichonephila clavipes]
MAQTEELESGRSQFLPASSSEVSFPATRGHGTLVVKVTDSWPVCQEFEPSEGPPSKGGRRTLNKSTLKPPSAGVEDRREVASSGVILVS